MPVACAQCGQVAKYRCTGCRGRTPYCSSGCQREHFEVHKKQCSGTGETLFAAPEDPQEKIDIVAPGESISDTPAKDERSMTTSPMLIPLIGTPSEHNDYRLPDRPVMGDGLERVSARQHGLTLVREGLVPEDRGSRNRYDVYGVIDGEYELTVAQMVHDGFLSKINRQSAAYDREGTFIPDRMRVLVQAAYRNVDADILEETAAEFYAGQGEEIDSPPNQMGHDHVFVDGASAVLVVVVRTRFGRYLFASNVGSCQAVMYGQDPGGADRTVRLSREHWGRVEPRNTFSDGPTRMFGMVSMKWPYNKSYSPEARGDFISVEPHIQVEMLEDSPRHHDDLSGIILVLGNRAFWRTWDDNVKEVGRAVRALRDNLSTPDQLAQRLVEQSAMRKEHPGELSVVVKVM